MLGNGYVYILKKNEKTVGYYYMHELLNMFDISRTKFNEYVDRKKTIKGVFRIIKTNKKTKPSLDSVVKVGNKKYKPFITSRESKKCNSGKTFWLPEWKIV